MSFKSLPLNRVFETAKAILEKAHIREAALQSRLITQHVLGLKNHLDTILDTNRIVSPSAILKIKTLAQRRSRHVPLQYLLGRSNFYNTELHVRRGCLIPRPETEILTDLAIRWLESHRREPLARVLDMGVGSGNIACSIAQTLNSSRVMGVDRSLKALRIARENVTRLGLERQITLIQSNFFKRVPENLSFDLIISNPPYIAKKAIQNLPDEIKNFEPIMALDGGVDGLEAVRHLILNAPKYLKASGALIFEFGGYHQTKKIEKILKYQSAFKKWHLYEDLAGKDRVFLLESEHG